MSWNGRRFVKKNGKSKERFRRQSKGKLTEHHVPPTSICGDLSKQFILQKSWRDHEAYHRLFGNVGSFEEARGILLRLQRLIGAYHQIFGNSKNFDEAAKVLKDYWWTKPITLSDN